jgi:hypothetical protein
MDDFDEEKKAEQELLEFDRKIYNDITDVFTKHGLQYRDAQAAYDKLTGIRASMEGFSVPGYSCKRYFVENLVEVIQDLADAMNAMRKGKSDEQ